jgi:predicted nucleotidyltransferase
MLKNKLVKNGVKLMTQQDEYVSTILQKYAVQTGSNSPAERNGNAIKPAIRTWAGQSLADIFFSGSYAKGTAVSGTTDIDLFISLKSDTPLENIYEGLYQFAARQGWQPRRQNVSIGINYNGEKIDLVPGRIQSGYQNYHSLYRSKTGSWTQTNVARHIEVVKNSQRTNEIRAIKIWRNLHNLDFLSFYLELTAINALYRCSTDDLAANVLHALKYIAETLPSARVVDPANNNNVISDDLTSSEKQVIALRASQSYQEKHWGQIIW